MKSVIANVMGLSANQFDKMMESSKVDSDEQKKNNV